MNDNNREFSFEIKANLCVLNKSSRGWTKEVNLVSWNGNPAKIDIREWDPNHQHMSRGVTLRRDEAELLINAIYGQLKREKEAEDRAVKESVEVCAMEEKSK